MRFIFHSVEDLIIHVGNVPGTRQFPYEVDFNGVIRYTLASNADQAIAAVARDMGVKVRGVPIKDILKAG